MIAGPRAQSAAMSDFAQALSSRRAGRGKLELDPENAQKGLAGLVLALLKLVHELLERQAIRRVDAGDLNAEQIERLGLTLQKQAEQLERLMREFGFSEEELNLNLGPLGRPFADGLKHL
jgi:Gas vesicle protein K